MHERQIPLIQILPEKIRLHPCFRASSPPSWVEELRGSG
jgi:hypothetical protein